MRRSLPLLVLLLLTLAAPGPRMAAWLLSASPRAYTSARQEPPSRGRNRIPSPLNSTHDFAGIRLASGQPACLGLVESPRLATSGLTFAATRGIIIAARTSGSKPLRC
jgi:hypothetical protein